MTWETTESSVQDAKPREFFTISTNDGVTVYRHTSGSRDYVDSNSALYTAIAFDRSEIAVTTLDDQRDMTLSLPIDHPLAVRYPQKSTPPAKIEVVVYNDNGGGVRQVFAGFIQDMSVQGRIAQFRVSSRVGEWMLRVVPSITVGRKCPHALYSAPCGVSRTGTGPSGLPHRVVTTVSKITTDRIIEVDLPTIPFTDPGRIDWAENGDIFFPQTGEYTSIRTHDDVNLGVTTMARLTLHEPIVGLVVGSTVHVFAGCSKRMDSGNNDCNDKFGARQSFGGFPQLPTADPFKPSGGSGVSSI